MPRHEAYLIEAQRLQAKYASHIHILIGFEGEFVRPAYADLVQSLATHPAIDYFLGSLHHACGVAIDFDKAYYAKARDAAGGTEESLYAAYYDEQYAMLTALRPRVVGHFDLVRLMSESPDREDLRSWGGGSIWEKIVRNLEVVRGCGGWLECNSSALRKGLAEPYPARAIAEEWLRMGGRFTMSDDSHGVAQVATNYSRALDYLESLGVEEVWTLEGQQHPGRQGGDARAALKEKSVTLVEFRKCLVARPN